MCFSFCQTQPAVCVSVVAATIAFSSLIISIKSYKKSKRLESFQRRDQLFAKISDFNSKNSEGYVISARYEIVALARGSLGLRGEQAEENRDQIARIKELAKKIEESVKNGDEDIKQLHSVCSSLTPKTDPARVEKLIALVHVMSDERKKLNDILSSSLHILETSDSILKASLAEFDRKVREIDLDLEKAIREFNEKSPD